MEWTHQQEKFRDDYSQEFRRSLWGTEAGIYLMYTNNGQDCRDRLERFAAAADRCLGWLDAHQADIFAAIEKDGLYDDAVEWLENNDTEERDGVTCALIYDGSRLPLPYRKEDFFGSLVPDGMSFSADFKSTRFIVDLFFNTEPDVFAGHSIEVFLKGSFAQAEPAYTISVNGLAG